ncbi:DUF3784 domain-containing protein [Pseudalkalibacillus berkeleyi]|uniref:DUF3784 domain-containing protein n=1 Tax=Pseudalkalibacillus berkeleyi TaxID=1069813 RepID=A0ABS9GXU3_9BACL|nr:DUF3784 domain-containing protein [Pseudalkalibacillus berkeleyi]MCF6136313.1 DUF3784 domain-containing protein [Pseudalkalibacillus berkeleyi]
MVTKQLIVFFLIGGALILMGAGFWLKKNIFLIKHYNESSISDKEGLAKVAGLYVIAIGALIFLTSFLAQAVGNFAWIILAVLVSLSSMLMLKIIMKYV